MAYEFGNYTSTWNDKDGKPARVDGSYLRVWQKVKGEWLVAAYFSRRNEPLSGGEKK